MGRWITTDFSTVYTYNADGTGNYQIFSPNGVDTADFKYTFDGGHIKVAMDTTADKYILLSVTDDGMGIKEEDRS